MKITMDNIYAENGIAITGHSAGIGLALSNIFEEQGNKIVGLSRRNGYNIRSLPKVADAIENCDMFINNAQVGYAQTDLLFEMFKRWKGKPKYIINISTLMTGADIAPLEKWDEYLIQKKTLEQAHHLLEKRDEWPKLLLVRPGSIRTQPEDPTDYQDVNEYAQGTVKWIVKNI